MILHKLAQETCAKGSKKRDITEICLNAFRKADNLNKRRTHTPRAISIKITPIRFAAMATRVAAKGILDFESGSLVD